MDWLREMPVTTINQRGFFWEREHLIQVSQGQKNYTCLHSQFKIVKQWSSSGLTFMLLKAIKPKLLLNAINPVYFRLVL